MRIVKLTLAALIVGVVLTYALAPTAVPPDDLGAGHEDAWITYIRDAGPAAAYVRFSDLVSEDTPPEQHTYAHFFGGALFRAVGTSGLATCDSRYSFGCFHEFLGEAIRDLGLDVVEALNAGCREALPQTFLSCQHGIGHGIYAHFRYDDDSSLFAALDACRRLPDADVIGGCYGGVFMEYNQRTMWGVSAQLRPATDDMHYPCSVVDEAFVTACTYWQPQWWIEVLRERFPESREARIREAGALCTASLDREHCFQGIGNFMLAESRDERGRPSVAIARGFCSAAAHSRADELHCLAITANHFGIDSSQEEAFAVCAELPPASKAYCEQYATNSANIANRIPFPDL